MFVVLGARAQSEVGTRTLREEHVFLPLFLYSTVHYSAVKGECTSSSTDYARQNDRRELVRILVCSTYTVSAPSSTFVSCCGHLCRGSQASQTPSKALV